MITWVLVLGIGLVVGVVAGIYFARLDDFSNKQKKILQQKLEFAEQQLRSYKSQVNEHFLITASLVNSMTESYKAVHAHLAVGARELCDTPLTEMQLEISSTKVLDKTVLPMTDKPDQSDPTAARAESVSLKQETKGTMVNEPVSETIKASANTEMSAEEGADETAVPIEPPSTPESLHTVENDASSSASLQDSENSTSTDRRTVH